MDGDPRLFAAPTTVELCGRTFEVRAKTQAVKAAVHRHLLDMRKDPLEEAIEKAKLLRDDPDMYRVLFEVAIKESTKVATIDPDEAAAWIGTLEGTAFVTWQCIRHNEGAPSVEEIEAWFYAEIDRLTAELEKIAEYGGDREAAAAVATEQVLQAPHSAINRAGGEDPAGKASGPSQAAEDQGTGESTGS